MEHAEAEIDLSVIADGEGDGGIEDGEMLLKIAEYSILPSERSFDDIRVEAIAQMGPEKFVDAVAVAATFNSLDRMANATGIPIEHNKMEMTEGVREELGLNELATANLPDKIANDENNGPVLDWRPASHKGL